MPSLPSIKLVQQFDGILGPKPEPDLPAYTSPTSNTPAWHSLCSHLHEWFCQPDLEALQIMLAIAHANSYRLVDPIWLFVVGPSGCGKSSLFITAATSFPRSCIMGDLTPNTLISGKAKGQSLLHKCGDSALLLFKDFTTFLSKRQEDRLALASQLREIHDGEWAKATGETGSLRWKGKLTIIAASTPELEARWALMRDLGERFITIRLRTAPLRDVAAAARRQVGHTAAIRVGIKDRVARMLLNDPEGSQLPLQSIPSTHHDQLNALACMVAQCRTHVKRLQVGKQDIIDVGAPELPTRLVTAVDVVPAAWAALNSRSLTPTDIALSQRLAVDSIPLTRWRIISALPAPSPAMRPLNIADIAALTGLTPRAISWHADELKAVRVLTSDPAYTEDILQLTPEFAALRSEALAPIR